MDGKLGVLIVTIICLW